MFALVGRLVDMMLVFVGECTGEQMRCFAVSMLKADLRLFVVDPEFEDELFQMRPRLEHRCTIRLIIHIVNMTMTARVNKTPNSVGYASRNVNISAKLLFVP